ncbi:MAG: YrdB family protein [Anaerolineaceae bacterium]|nr:YrdB family protein [Anaerolineaceae bacterium]
MLAQHPANLLLRFALQIIALVGVAQWGWGKSPALGIGIPLLLALVWLVFTTPGDPGHKNRTLVPIQGWVRLLLEAALFTFALVCFFAQGQVVLMISLLLTLLLHYFWSAERVVWLLKH